MGNATQLTRPVLRYHGGKWLLAPWIISHFPPHRIYTECFGGGGSVLMRKPRASAEVYNDLWSTIVDVFRVLRDPAMAEELERRIRLTPYARAEFELCDAGYIAGIADIIERARLTLFRASAGYGSAAVNGNFATGFRRNATSARAIPSQDWGNYPDNIAAFTDRLKGVLIENRQASEVLSDYDSPETLHYVDPPYVHATRNMRRGNASYAHEMTDTGHRELSATLHSLKGAVALSGYRSDLYDELFSDWTRIDRAAHADGAADRIECLWLNPKCANLQSRLF